MTAETDTRIIDVTLPSTIADEFERRADSMQLLAEEYCEIIVKNWLVSGNSFTTAGA
jgi:hypothetical protein